MYFRFPRLALALGSVIALLLAAPHASLGSTTLSVPTDGTSNATTADMAEQIQVPITADTQLDSFQFSGIGAGGNTTFQAFVYQFDPVTSQTVGPALYSSPVTVATEGFPLQTFSFSTGGVDLAPGEQILLDLHQRGFGNADNLQMASNKTDYSGSEFRVLQNDGIYWTAGQVAELQFQATFATPEPASLSLMALAVPFLLLSRNRNRSSKNAG